MKLFSNAQRNIKLNRGCPTSQVKVVNDTPTRCPGVYTMHVLYSLVSYVRIYVRTYVCKAKCASNFLGVAFTNTLQMQLQMRITLLNVSLIAF